MRSFKLKRILAISAVSLAAALFLLTLYPALRMQPGAVQAQDATDYPFEETFFFPDYPIETEFADEFDTPQPEATLPPFPTDQDNPISTPTTSPTVPVNAFLTENAQMGEGQNTLTTQEGTPQATQSPAPSITPYRSPTPWLHTPSPAPLPGSGGASGGMDWGLFWIGFSLPVLAGCGLVLYLLDRRPELFRPRG